jgi:hypothetical protein
MNGDTFKFTMIGDDQLTRPLRNAENQMKRLGNEVNRTNKQMGAFSSNLANAGRGGRAFAMGGLQQAGYQIGDFAVQVANGTNKMQAFGQQAPQFLQIFGPIGSVVGAAVAVFAALAVVQQKTSGTTKTFAKDMADLKMQTAEAAKQFAVLAANVKSYGEVVALQKILELQTKIADKNAEISDKLEKRSSGFRRRVKNLQSEVGILEEQAFQIEEELRLYREATTQREKALAINKQMLAVEVMHAKILGDQKRAVAANLSAYQEYYQSRVAAATMASRTELKDQQEAHFAQIKIMGETMQQGIANAARIKQAYAEYYASRILGEKAAREAAEGKSVKGGRGQDPRQFTYLDEFRKQLKAQEDARTAANRASSKAAVKLKESIIELTPEMQRIMDVSESIGQSFENAFMSAVDGSMKAKDAFRTMAADIIKELYRVFVVKQITGFITDAASLFLGPKVGAVSMGPKAIGGPVQAGGSYLVGERGPELFRPARSGSITPNDQLGGGTIVVNQTINVSTGVQQTVRTEIKSLMPQIAESAKAAVADAKRRGGSYGRAFA